jgi:endo-1,4-beta-mannosidase
MNLKILFTLALLLFSVSGWSFTKGFNQAWLKNNYGFQWLDQTYDQKYVEDLMILNKEGGSEILRMWLYEGAGLSQFIYNQNDGTLKLKPEILKNLTHFLKMARKHHLKVNLTFLDGNAFGNFAKNQQLGVFWWNVFNSKYGMLEQFYQAAIVPIYQLVGQNFKDVVTQIDLVNEVNALIFFGMFEDPKASMSSFLCKLGHHRPVAVTASLGWLDAEARFFEGILSNSCLDFYDIHLYNDFGAIPRCTDFQRLSNQGYILQLGEFGQKSQSYDDNLQAQVTSSFLKNAINCGFKSALAWRLDDNREGYNPEARHSYMAYGAARKGYFIFRDFLE